MDPIIIGYIGIAAFFFLLILGVRIAFAAALVGLAGVFFLKDFGAAGSLVGYTSYVTTSNYSWSVIPLFVIMGFFAFHGGVTTDIYSTARQWVGHLPGGLMMSTFFGAAGFAAASGSSTASAAIMGKISVPEMRDYGYDPKLACGAVAASGTMASMIPPAPGCSAK